MNFDFKNGYKNEFKDNLEFKDPEKGLLTKSISKPYGRATAMPPAWELILWLSTLCDQNRLLNKSDLLSKPHFHKPYEI